MSILSTSNQIFRSWNKLGPEEIPIFFHLVLLDNNNKSPRPRGSAVVIKSRATEGRRVVVSCCSALEPFGASHFNPRKKVIIYLFRRIVAKTNTVNKILSTVPDTYEVFNTWSDSERKKKNQYCEMKSRGYIS